MNHQQFLHKTRLRRKAYFAAHEADMPEFLTEYPEKDIRQALRVHHTPIEVSELIEKFKKH